MRTAIVAHSAGCLAFAGCIDLDKALHWHQHLQLLPSFRLVCNYPTRNTQHHIQLKKLRDLLGDPTYQRWPTVQGECTQLQQQDLKAELMLHTHAHTCLRVGHCALLRHALGQQLRKLLLLALVHLHLKTVASRRGCVARN